MPRIIHIVKFSAELAAAAAAGKQPNASEERAEETKKRS